MPTPPIFQTITPSPLGNVLLAASEKGLVGVWFVERQQHMPLTDGWIPDPNHPTLTATAKQLKEYFEDQRQHFDLPLHYTWGTPFQRAVWQALHNIPYGKKSTYGSIATAIGNPKAVRAVGAAIGQNPHSIIVPCHRVVGASGTLTGYAGGVDRKASLLSHEARLG